MARSALHLAIGCGLAVVLGAAVVHVFRARIPFGPTITTAEEIACPEAELLAHAELGEHGCVEIGKGETVWVLETVWWGRVVHIRRSGGWSGGAKLFTYSDALLTAGELPATFLHPPLI